MLNAQKGIHYHRKAEEKDQNRGFAALRREISKEETKSIQAEISHHNYDMVHSVLIEDSR
jgi:hypothetical protein